MPDSRGIGPLIASAMVAAMGDRSLRSLLVTGATSTLWRQRKKKGGWLAALLERKTPRQASVALANKMARIAWAVLAKGAIDNEAAAPAACPDNRNSRLRGR